MKINHIVSTLLGVLLFFPTFAFAEPARKDGMYSGIGQWRDSNGQSGEYLVQTNIKHDGIDSNYQWGEGETRTFSLGLEANGINLFSAKLANEVIGWFYCLDVQCHLDLAFPSSQDFEETLTFVGNKLYKLGSKSLPNGTRVFWQEDLDMQE